MRRLICLVVVASLVFTSCVSSAKFKKLEQENNECSKTLAKTKRQLKETESANENLAKSLDVKKKELPHFDEMFNDEIKEKIRQSKLGDKNPMRICGGLHGPRNGMYGKNGKLNPFAKRCKAVSVDGSDTKYFDTLTELQQYFNVTTLGMVTMRCRGKTKSPYNGYYFRYCEDDEKSQTTIERIATD